MAAHKDVLTLIGSSSEAMADCILTMKMAGEKALTAAVKYESLVKECDSLGLPSQHYAGIARTFRGIEQTHREVSEGFGDTVEMCLRLAEVCR